MGPGVWGWIVSRKQIHGDGGFWYGAILSWMRMLPSTSSSSVSQSGDCILRLGYDVCRRYAEEIGAVNNFLRSFIVGLLFSDALPPSKVSLAMPA